MRKILLIITGSIAAYKTLDLIRMLRKSDYQVNCIMTKAAKEFITPLLVSSISGNEVYQELFSLQEESKMGHINLSRDNDLIIVAPASADIITKISSGIADDLASTVLLAANKPIFVAPAMNEKMWLNQVNQENINKLRARSIKILEPQSDILACGEYGIGKMIAIEEIFNEIEKFFNQVKLFQDKKVIITTGATFEPIDPVRFIGNYSSGKQGISIAQKFYEAGAKVTLIAANVSQNINLEEQNIIRVKTAQEMLKAVEENLKNSDIFISCAAVADFKPKEYSPQKIKKGKNQIDKIELIENIDILKTIGNCKDRPKIVVGFAAESEDLIKNASKKLMEKNCDLIIANNINNGEVFGSDYNQISILAKNGAIENFDLKTKSQIGEILVDRIYQIAKN